MPARPAPTSAGRGSSQRQGSDEERAVKLLERLAAAADLGAFAVLPGDESCLHGIGPGLVSSVQSGAAAAAGSPGHALLAAWMAAVARGMQLAAQQLELSRQRSAILLCNLVETISLCLHTLQAAGPGDGGREPMRVALSVLAVRAGVVKAHEQLSLRLASIISRSQPASSSTAAAAAAQKQQQQRIPPEVANLATHHLQMFTSLPQAWPGSATGPFSPLLCQAVPAAAGLAVAVLRHKEVLVRSERVKHSTWQAANNVVAMLGNAYSSAGPGGSVPAQVADSSSVGTLLLMRLGLAAQWLHQLQHGLSPAAVGAAPLPVAAGQTGTQQQRLAVPAHHTQLLQALGVAVDGAHPNSQLAAQAVAYWGQALGSLLATPGQRRHLADAAAAASCQLPLLLVLLECALLDGTRKLVAEVSFMLQDTFADSAQTAWQLAPPLLRAILEQDACRRALEAAAPAPAAASASAAPPGALSVLEVLALLATEVNAAVVASAYVNAGGVDAAFNEAVFHRLLAGVAAVWLEHPAQYASLLEAALRTLPPDRELLRSAVASACALEATASARLNAGSGAMAADSQQQVFALLLSCLKAAAVAAAEQGSSSSQGAAASKDAEQTCESAGRVVRDAILACCWLLVPSSSGSSDHASSSGTINQPSMAAPAAAADAAAARPSAQLGCVLLARCLVAAGRLLQQQAQAPARDGDSRCGDTRLYMHRFSLLVDACCSGVALLAEQAAAEPWWQQLLEEHGQLAQQLESLQAQMPPAGRAGNPAQELQPPAAAVAGVAEQLQAFGAAVCAVLPVQQCCNHHDCRNLQQASELELVGGKSCVCGGCRLARYCSRECQVAHYKGWHKAVCKRLQAQRQQQQGAAAQQQL